MSRKISFGIAILLLLVADQYSKYMAVCHLKDQMPVPIIKNIFELYYLENRGAAFGSFQGRQWGLLVFTCIALGFLTYLYRKIPKERTYVPLRITMTLFFSGAIGNMIDRVMQGYVVDFLYFKWIDFPIFNLADCYVTIAAFCFAILVIFVYKEEDLQFLGKKR